MRQGERQRIVRLKQNDHSPSRPCNLESWLIFEQNGRSAVTPDVQFGDTIHDPTERTGS